MLSQSCTLVKREKTYFVHICKKCCAISPKSTCKIVHHVGSGHARPAAYRHILFTIQSVGEGFIPPGHLPAAASLHGGQRAGRPTTLLKNACRAGCPHPAETYRHIPFPHRRPVGAGHARPAAYRHILFTIQSVGEGFIPPGHLPPPQASAAARGLAALRPRLKTHA